MAAAAWFLLWEVRQSTEAQSGLGVSVAGIPDGSLHVCVMGWYTCLVGCRGTPCEYRDSLKTVKGLEEVSKSLKLAQKG